MTARISEPGLRAIDANGIPISGALLYVYDVGTTTLKSIYSDTGLSVALANPLTSDSSGYFAVAYLAAGTYKLVCTTAAGVSISGLTADNLDTGLNAGAGALAITGGGTGSTTAASARTALGAAAQADVDSLSAQVATLSTSLQNLITTPQGRLTLTSGTPVLVTGITAGSSVYYTPYVGNQCPIWDGTQFIAKTFTELTLSLVAQHLASSILDVFIFLDGSTVTIGTGPAWTTATAGAGDRGTGAGTTELERKNGLWTNKVSVTARNGSSTYTVDANKGTYVGSLFMDGTNGQITAHTTWGSARKFGHWNAYHRVPVLLQCGDSTASWNYQTGSFRAANNSTNNKITLFTGLAEEPFALRYSNSVSFPSSSGAAQTGIGWNSTSAASGYTPTFTNGVAAGMSLSLSMAKHDHVPALGINVVTALELGSANNGGPTFLGTEANMILEAVYRA